MYNRKNIFSSYNAKREIKKRTWTLMVIFILIFCFLIWKNIYNMCIKGPARKAMAEAQYRVEEIVNNQNYVLQDCKGQELLDYKVSYYACIVPRDYFQFNEYSSKYDLEALTITLRNYDNKYDIEKLDHYGNTIKYKIDEDTYDKLKSIKGVRGFYSYAANEVIRDKIWKVENLLSNPKDYKNNAFKSANSLEMQIYNKTKDNKYTKIRFEKDDNRELSEGKIVYPEKNVNVKLTLDKEIQEKIENILHEEKYKKYPQIGVVLMESSNGKIRGIAQKDDNAYNVNLGMLGTNGFYAGSIFKIIVDEAGLDTNLISKDKKYKVKGTLFPDSHERFSEYNISQALVYSSNDIFAQLGWKIGFDNMYTYAKDQGLLDKVLNFHDEQRGTFEVDLSNPKVDDISHSAIGQKIRLTPLEAISIPNTIINNGIYIQPSILEAYVNSNNQIIEQPKAKTYQLLKRETAEEVKTHMINVVNYGTGNLAYIKNMKIGGKTGTSEYYVNGKKYSDGWFVGFFNLHGKNYSMVVFVPNIYVNQKGNVNKQDEEGGTTAVPIFKEIVEVLSGK